MSVPWSEPTAGAADRRLAWLVSAVFVLLTFPRLLLHETWRDEAWEWLVVIESRTLGELFAGLERGGGQGYLFPLVEYVARQVSTSPHAQQLVNLLVAAAATFVFVRWAPLRPRLRVLFVLGYFVFYDYAVISRGNYAGGVLCIWLACLATQARRAPLWLGLTLGMLAQTTIFGILVGIGVLTGWAAGRWLHRRELPLLDWRDVALGTCLAIAGLIAGLTQMSPAPGTKTGPWFLTWDFERVRGVATLGWRAFVPLPRPQLEFWNTNLLDPWPLLQFVAGIATLLLALVMLRRSRLALITFVVGAMGLFAFSYVFYGGQARHYGHLWILFVAALWLGEGGGWEPRSWRSRVFSALLVTQIAAALFATWVDLRHPFSNARAAAQLVHAGGLDALPLLGHREPPAASVALHLGRPLWSPSREIYATHPDWGAGYREMSDAELRCQARALARREGSDIGLVINRELPPWEETEPLGVTHGAIERKEDYAIYRLYRDRLEATVGAAGCPGEAEPTR